VELVVNVRQLFGVEICHGVIPVSKSVVRSLLAIIAAAAMGIALSTTLATLDVTAMTRVMSLPPKRSIPQKAVMKILGPKAGVK